MLRNDHGSLYLIETYFFIYIYIHASLCVYINCDMPKGRKKQKYLYKIQGSCRFTVRGFSFAKEKWYAEVTKIYPLHNFYY